MSSTSLATRNGLWSPPVVPEEDQTLVGPPLPPKEKTVPEQVYETLLNGPITAADAKAQIERLMRLEATCDTVLGVVHSLLGSLTASSQNAAPVTEAVIDLSADLRLMCRTNQLDLFRGLSTGAAANVCRLAALAIVGEPVQNSPLNWRTGEICIELLGHDTSRIRTAAAHALFQLDGGELAASPFIKSSLGPGGGPVVRRIGEVMGLLGPERERTPGQPSPIEVAVANWVDDFRRKLPVV